jgi:hypothetical protein
VDPPRYENALNQQSYNPATYTDDGGIYERSNLLPYHQSSNYGSVPAPRNRKTISIPLGLFVLAAISLIIVTIYFQPQHVRDRIRREWEAEERAHQVMRDFWNSERQAIAAEREKLRRERTDHENRERQEEEEKRALIVWQDLKASTQCLRYGTREYTATLAQVSLGLDPLKECWKKSIDIHGRQVFPSRCDTQV